MKVIVDVNVWISALLWVSALLWGGIPAKILHLARQQKIIIFASDAIILELETTPKTFYSNTFQIKLSHNRDYETSSTANYSNSAHLSISVAKTQW